MPKKTIIHESIKEGSSSENCSLCANWGADIHTQYGWRKAHGSTNSNGLVRKECKVLGHLAVPACVCAFFNAR